MVGKLGASGAVRAGDGRTMDAPPLRHARDDGRREAQRVCGSGPYVNYYYLS